MSAIGYMANVMRIKDECAVTCSNDTIDRELRLCFDQVTTQLDVIMSNSMASKIVALLQSELQDADVQLIHGDTCTCGRIECPNTRVTTSV